MIDHILCANVHIVVSDDKGQEWPIDVGLWWCGALIIGGLHYCRDSPQLLNDIQSHILSSIE